MTRHFTTTIIFMILLIVASCNVEFIHQIDTEDIGSDTGDVEFRAFTDWPEVGWGAAEMCCPVIGGQHQREYCTPGNVPADCDALPAIPSKSITSWRLSGCYQCGDGYSGYGDLAWASYGPGWGYECFGQLRDADVPYWPTPTYAWNAFDMGDNCWSPKNTDKHVPCPAGTTAACKAGATECQTSVYDSEEDSTNWLDIGDEMLMCCKDNGSSCVPLDDIGNCPNGASTLGYTVKMFCSQCNNGCQGWDLIRDGAASQTQEQLESLQCGKKVDGLVPLRYHCDGELWDPSAYEIVKPCPASSGLCID